MAMLGLIAGPVLVAAAIAVMFDVIERGGTVQGIATIPEFIWELSFGIYLIVKGFRPSPIIPDSLTGPGSVERDGGLGVPAPRPGNSPVDDTQPAQRP
jgi:hypothetical protein